MKAKWIFKIILGIALFGALAGWVVMSLWNWLVPTLFAGPLIGFWQALGLLVLSKILFGSSGGWKRNGRCRDDRWKARWEGMSPEERDRVRSLWKKRCGWERPSARTEQETES